ASMLFNDCKWCRRIAERSACFTSSNDSWPMDVQPNFFNKPLLMRNCFKSQELVKRDHHC
ncbi:Hypothetical protein FKW44_010798, partial [Caligus rogercresseyi]